MWPNFPSTRHKNKLAIKLATKQVSINMISISIKEGWGWVKHVWRPTPPTAAAISRFSNMKSFRPPVTKIPDLWLKIKKKSTLAYFKGNIWISKQGLYFIVANSSEESGKIWFFEAKMKQKQEFIEIYRNCNLWWATTIFSENKFQLLNSQKNLFSYELQLFICFPKFLLSEVGTRFWLHIFFIIIRTSEMIKA